eukprot:TRINITY_DN69965_c0_g1_i1.p1 TRINITY_DN69965_c0_g1~~TRINITY_DN69965_c0_g1_i1.p1  ORF type:complete len:3098 (+),score=817.94 TRINITY_DN69965_c0_g1_i1:65-9358(+)
MPQCARLRRAAGRRGNAAASGRRPAARRRKAAAALLLLCGWAVPAQGAYSGTVQVTDGYPCGLQYNISETDGTLSGCEGYCAADSWCSAFTWWTDGFCRISSACPVLGRFPETRHSEYDNETAYAATYLLRSTAVYDDDTVRTFADGNPADLPLDHGQFGYGFTVDLWAKVDGGDGARRTVLSTLWGHHGYRLYASPAGLWSLDYGNLTHTLTLTATTPTGPYTSPTSPRAAVQTQVWTRLTVSFDGFSQTLRFDINGGLAAVTTAALNMSDWRGGQFARLGSDTEDAWSGHLTGQVKDVRFWAVALDPEGIAAITADYPATCPAAESPPGIALAVGHAVRDHGASLGGRCLYLAPGHESCAHACNRMLPGSQCDAEGTTATAQTPQACEAAMQRLGVLYQGVGDYWQDRPDTTRLAVSMLWEGHWCQHPAGRWHNLGHFATPKLCGDAVMANPGCGWSFQYAPKWPQWGCMCCAGTGLPTKGHYDGMFNVYVLSYEGTPGADGVPVGQDKDGCTWSEQRWRLTAAAGSDCNTPGGNAQPPARNGTRLRVCSCANPFLATETRTLRATTYCGPSTPVCHPCPRILFREPAWETVSWTAACAASDAFDQRRDVGGLAQCKLVCESYMYTSMPCGGVDYWEATDECVLYPTICSAPAEVANSSSSHRLVALPPAECHPDGLLSDLPADQLGFNWNINDSESGNVCACRRHCIQTQPTAVYGAIRSNVTDYGRVHYFCMCYSKCDKVVSTVVGPLWGDRGASVDYEFATNVTTFVLGIPQKYTGCMHEGGIHMGAATGGAPLGVLELSGGVGLTLDAYFRHDLPREPAPAVERPAGGFDIGLDQTQRRTGGTSRRWGVRHVESTKWQWDVCEFYFYDNDDCAGGNTSAIPTTQVQIYPPAPDRPASLSVDGRTDTCSAVDCGEPPSGHGCSAGVASYHVTMPVPITARCLKIWQYENRDTMSPIVSVEAESNTGIMTEQWRCEGLQPGKWQQCSRGTGLLYFEAEQDGVTWDQARGRCRDLGGDLASVHSEGANEAALRLIRRRQGYWDTDYRMPNRAWIGAHRDSNGGRDAAVFKWSDETDWKWATATSTFVNENVSAVVDEHPRDYSNWACGNQMPGTGEAWPRVPVCYISTELSYGAEQGDQYGSWSNGKITVVGSASGWQDGGWRDGRVHGPWDHRVKEVSKSFILPAAATECTIKWRAWSLHTRDNEESALWMDGVKVWSEFPGHSQLACPTGWTRQYHHRFHFGDKYFGGPHAPQPDQSGIFGATPVPTSEFPACYRDLTHTAACSGTLAVKFTGLVDQDYGDESWGFSNFELIVDDCRPALPERNNHQPSGRKDPAWVDYGGDCAFMFKEPIDCAEEGTWGAVSCGVRLPGFICNVTAPRADIDPDNVTATQTATKTVPVVEDGITQEAATLFSCGNGATEDTVSLLQDNESMTYEVTWSKAAAWPKATPADSRMSVPRMLEQGDDWRRVTVLHRDSGATTILIDRYPAGDQQPYTAILDAEIINPTGSPWPAAHVPFTGAFAAPPHYAPLLAWLRADKLLSFNNTVMGERVVRWADSSQNILDVYSYLANTDPLVHNAHPTGDGPDYPAPRYVPLGAARWPSVRFSYNSTETPLTARSSDWPVFNGTGMLVCVVARPTGTSVLPFLLHHGTYADEKHWGIIVGADKIIGFVTPSQGGAELWVSPSDLNPPGGKEGADGPGPGYQLVCLRVQFHTGSQAGRMELRVNGHVVANKTVTVRGVWPDTHPHKPGTGEGNYAFVSSAQVRGEYGGPFTIGTQSTTIGNSSANVTTTNFEGDLTEVVIYDQDLGDNGTAALEAALATKYFGGPFVRHPSNMPRRFCALGAPVSVARVPDYPAELGGNLHFEGSVRDLGLWEAEVPRTDRAKLAAAVVAPGEVRPGRIVRAAGCTSQCAPNLHASGPTQVASGAGWVSSLPPGDCVFEGTVKLNDIPSGDQPLVTYGGHGCGPGGLALWAFPAQGGFGLAVGEWGGHAVRTEVGYPLNETHLIRVDFDIGVGPADPTLGITTKTWAGDEFINVWTMPSGYWMESPKEDQCGHRPYALGGYQTDGPAAHCLVAARPANLSAPEREREPARDGWHATAVLRSPEFVLSARSSIAVDTYGAATPEVSVCYDRDLWGFAGVALRDALTDIYLLNLTRAASAGNVTGFETLQWTPSQLRPFTGRRVTVDFIDALCTAHCEEGRMGWIGFSRATFVDVDVRVAQARIQVDGSIEASGLLSLELAPIEAGGVALLARCHNDPTSGTLKADVRLTAGCAANITLADRDQNLPSADIASGVSGREVLVADVDGSTWADAKYWWDKCQSIPNDADYIKVVMGEVVDYFRPVHGVTYCGMLMSDRKHQWSNSVWKISQGAWVTPEYHLSGFGPETSAGGTYRGQGFPVGPSNEGYGGSQYKWPNATRQSFWRDDTLSASEYGNPPRPRLHLDERFYLSFWGPDGGCCHMSLNDGASWKRAFKLYYVKKGAGSVQRATATQTVTPSITPEPGCFHHFTGAAADYYAAGAGGPGAGWLGPMTLGGELTIAAWVRMTDAPQAGSQIIDIANAPQSLRVALGFFSDSGSVVYRVEQHAPYYATRSGLGDPEKHMLPSTHGSGQVPNEYIGGSYHSSIHPTEEVGGEYLMFKGCFSEFAMNGFGGGPNGRHWSSDGDSLKEGVEAAIRGGYRYVALAHLPPYDGGGYQIPAPGRRLIPGVPHYFIPSDNNGGRWVFNVLTSAADLHVDHCRAVACNSTQGVCGCAGGLCGPHAIATGRCQRASGLLGNCSLRAESWALWERVFWNGPTVPADTRWHHVAVVHKFDTTQTVHLSMATGTATLYVDFVELYSAQMQLPLAGERVDCFVGRSNNGDPDFIGDIKEVYIWNKALTLADLTSVAQRTLPATHAGVLTWADSRGFLVRAGVQNCAAPPEGYGQCVAQKPALPGSMAAFVGSARIRDPRMCARPQCECSYNGFRCAVSAWGRDFMETTQWGEPWGARPFDFVWGWNQKGNIGRFGGGGVPGITTRHSRGRCHVDTDFPEGCICEGTITFFSFDPRRVRKPVTCGDVLHAFGGKLRESLPDEFMVPTAAGEVLCPNVATTRLY